MILMFSFKLDILKFASFGPVMFIMICIAYILALDYNFLQKVGKLRLIINLMMFAYFAGGLMYFFEVSFFGVITSRKPILVFSEPSHYALSMSLYFLPFLVLNQSFALSLLSYGFFIFLAIKSESLTLILCLLLALAPFFKSVFSKIIVYTGALCAILLGMDEYFLKRVNIQDVNETNIIFFQGLDQIVYNIFRNYGLGVGPQQMGVEDPTGDYASIAYDLSGVYLNRYDGSFAASKLLTEFGLLGLIALIYYMFILSKAYRYLVMYIHSGGDTLKFIGSCFIYTSLIYFFFRGGGYFTSVFLHVIVGFILFQLPTSKVLTSYSK